MTDFLERIESAREHVSPRWTAARERSLRWQLESRLERRRTTGRVLAGMALVVALIVGHLGYSQWIDGAPKGAVGQRAQTTKGARTGIGGAAAYQGAEARAASGRGERVGGAEAETQRGSALKAAVGVASVQLTDGTVAQGMSADAHLLTLEESVQRVTMRLASGRARFDVTPRAERTFRVEARNVAVTVLGTQFTVELLADGVRVGVERGRVEVEWPGERRVLGAGEEVTAGGEEATVGESSAVGGGAASAAGAANPGAQNTAAPGITPPGGGTAAAGTSVNGNSMLGSAAASKNWRSLAQEGDYAGAFAVLSQEGAGSIRQEPGDLLFAADVARLSGHPAQALPQLERVVRSYPSDSRAPLAAFTLGRILLDSLGRPREAAEAFARCRKLAPGGALSQDALAREVESWSRAGEATLARDRAIQYLRLFPGGRREKAVRYHGGLEGTQ
ncbi:MAG TPA: FecR domain-containing protein [Polyangiaceae bacterium]|nr:FecR domain-containing protein [Polyangiaceae bacterium]